MMTAPIKSPRKLIEVALPLDAINAAAAREKSIRHGHPSTLHLWWARRPLAAARAVLFAQLVNDPGYQQGGGFKYGMNQEAAAVERERLFGIIRDLVLWENTTNEEVLERARAEIRRSWREVCELNRDHPQAAELFNPDVLPAFHDPFAGGGSIPLEAQRLGLEAYASDLNPVAVLINKAMIEIPPKFAGMPPVNPEARSGENGQGAMFAREWKGAQGLAEDVRYYGKWMRDEAEKRIGHLYPKVKITAEMATERPDLQPLVGQELTVIAWLWARTVKSPNPAFSHVDVPLASTFMLSTKEGKEAYVEPEIDGESYEFVVKVGKAPANVKNGTKAGGSHSPFVCLMSGVPISFDYIRAESRNVKLGTRLMAIVAEGKRGRIYLSPTEQIESVARSCQPNWKPELSISHWPGRTNVVEYGLSTFSDLFTPRQLVALTTFSDLVLAARDRVSLDIKSVLDHRNDADGFGRDYAEAIAVYLAFGSSRAADAWSSIVTWRNQVEASRNTFSRQAIPMTWDFTEVNPFSDSCGNWLGNSVDWVMESLLQLPSQPYLGFAYQAPAQVQTLSTKKIVSTDPPYYDNIEYADLSDYFYVWLRRTLREQLKELFGTIGVPKSEELVANPYRHGSKQKAEAFFLTGMSHAIRNLGEHSHPAYPVTIYYAFKQSDTDIGSNTSSTGWETFLEAVVKSGFSLTGTWPVRTEKEGRVIGNGTNALASSIVLVCRKRPVGAPICSRRDFVRELNTVLPDALAEMTRGSQDGGSPVAPVDLSQAIIGPGMAVFSKYSAVLEANGEPMRVRTALQLINRFLAEDDFDADTQFCLHWFEQHGWATGRFGEADTLARAKGTSVEGVRDSGVIEAGGGSVRLRKWAEYPAGWQPGSDSRNPMWETLHHLIRSLKAGAGEGDAGALLGATRGQAEAVRQLAYRLYTLCERQGWAEDARAYNELITSWTAIEEASAAAPAAGADPLQSGLFD